jgi:hypothetical protein
MSFISSHPNMASHAGELPNLRPCSPSSNCPLFMELSRRAPDANSGKRLYTDAAVDVVSAE